VEPGELERDESMDFPEDLVAQMKDLGLLGIPFPEEYGGAGMDTLSYVIAVEEISRISGSLGLTLAAHVSLGTSPIYEFGTEEQRKKYVPKLASGEMIGSFGLTEPNAGSDAQGTETTAVRDGDEWVVNGQKIYVTNGSYAGTIIFTAVTSKEPREISAFIVDKGTFWGDLLPTAHHVSPARVMAYDLAPLRVIGQKSLLLEEAAEKNWLGFMHHDLDPRPGRVDKDGVWKDRTRE